MHIEPGLVSAAKVAVANVAAVGLVGAHALQFIRQPQLVVRSLLAALFFSLFMQSFHLPAGPSELHFIGAMPIYLILGFVPTVVGFGAGLLAQGLLFEPADLANLGVNTLSLAVPLLVLHHTVGKRIDGLNVRDILKLDAIYYAGVALMVGFWLSIGETATPFAAWAGFAAHYLPVVLIEPLVTIALVGLLRPHAAHPALRLCTTLRTA